MMLFFGEIWVVGDVVGRFFVGGHVDVVDYLLLSVCIVKNRYFDNWCCGCIQTRVNRFRSLVMTMSYSCEWNAWA